VTPSLRESHLEILGKFLEGEKGLEEQSSFHIGEHSSEDGWGEVALVGVELVGDDGYIPWDVPFGVVDTV